MQLRNPVNMKFHNHNGKCGNGCFRRCWHARLHTVYDSFEEFKAYDETYGICARLGLPDVKQAWYDNPIIAGSVNPHDLHIVHEKPKRV